MKKHLRITWNAPVVLSIVAVSFAATLLNYLTGGRSGLLFIYDIPFFPPVTDDVDPDVCTYFWTCGLVTFNG